MQPYYQDDMVTLYLGDCREVTEWATADVLVTDPPYGIGYRGSRSTGRTKEERYERYHERKKAGMATVASDRDTTARDAMLSLWGPERPGLVFGSWRVERPANVVQRLLWIKNDSVHRTGLSQMAWITGDEEIYAIGDSLTRFGGKPRKGFYITTEVRSNAVKDIGHPTPKPIPLMEALIEKCPLGVIADPFAGSGSTLIASRNLGRRAIGVELEERYCEIAAKRLAQQPLVTGVFE